MAENEPTEPEPTGPATTSETDPPAEDPGDDIEKMRAALHKANEEAKKHRLKAKELEPFAAKAKELEDAQKTEQERLTEKLSATEKRAVDAELRAARLEVATEKGLPKSSVKFLTGTTEEELAESADELLALLDSSSEDPKPRPDQRPRERLKPGSGDPDAPVEPTDLNKLGERMFTS